MTASSPTAGTPLALGRRELLVGAGVAVVAAAFAGPARGALDLLPFIGERAEPFARAAIVDRIGEQFRVASGDATGAIIKITDVFELTSTRIADLENQFIVRFVGTPGLLQDTYEFATASFGRLPLFITPLGEPTGTTAVYEAIVNRWVPEWARGGTS